MKLKGLILFAALLMANAIVANTQHRKYTYTVKINPDDVTIIRDKWGVPHVFGKTDADAAYGLAWANAEDAFHLMQENLLPGTGLSAKMDGRKGAEVDYFLHGIGAREMVNERFETDIPPDFRKYLEGYTQGVNAYAKAHPEEIKLKKAFPITPKDILTAYVVSQAFLSGASGPVSNIFDGKFDDREVQLASNAFALNSNRTKDGKTYLCINPHFQMDGPYTFYEAHIASEEGLNMHGALFQGGTSMAMGSNPNLGWGMTWNSFDRGDVYQLKMHPKKRLTYEFDGEWISLEKRPVWLKVRVGRKLVIPVRKKTYWSKYGPTFKSPEGHYYSVLYPSTSTIKTAEQLFRMNKAANLGEFKDALRILGLAMFNIVYADKEDNLFYINFGRIAKRDTTYHSDDIMAGNTSANLWTGIHSIEDMAQTENPECGYIFNTNNSPFNATCTEFNDDPERMPFYIATDRSENNRSCRIMEFFNASSKFNYDEFKAIKFDCQYPESSPFIESIKSIYEVDPEKHPDVYSEISFLQSWDRIADRSSHEATFFMVLLDFLFEMKDCGLDCLTNGIELNEEEWVEGIRHAQGHLVEHFDSTTVPLRDFYRMTKGSVDVPAIGFPDALSASYGEKWENGRFRIIYADTYTHFVRFGDDGPEIMETLVPFGASFRETSPHFADQVDLAHNQMTKRVSLDKEELLKSATRVYHPGE